MRAKRQNFYVTVMWFVIVQGGEVDLAKYTHTDPSADHTGAALTLDGLNDNVNALRSFRAAVQFAPEMTTFLNLGVCLMRMNNLKAAEDNLLRAFHLTVVPSDKMSVQANLDALAGHQAFARGDPIEGAKYVHRGDIESDLDNLLKKEYKEPFVEWELSDIESNKAESLGYPFVLRNATRDWAMIDNWPQEWRSILLKHFPDAVVDFYPYNMLRKDRSQAYLVRLPKAISELEASESSSHFSPKPAHGTKGRYAHLQLTPQMWQTLEDTGDLPADRHSFFKKGDWLNTCLDSQLSEEWHLKTHWKVLLIGMKGAGMFNHSDSLLTSSWHAHIVGRKWWRVCGETPDASRVCYEEVLKPGDVLYYPKHWHHATRSLDTPTITLTDTVFGTDNAKQIFSKVYGECTGKDPLGFDMSVELCDAMLLCGVEYWKNVFTKSGIPWPNESKYASWRKNTDPNYLAVKETVMPWHNNYDGRNYITE